MNVENTIGIFNFIELEYLATAHRIMDYFINHIISYLNHITSSQMKIMNIFHNLMINVFYSKKQKQKQK